MTEAHRILEAFDAQVVKSTARNKEFIAASGLTDDLGFMANVELIMSSLHAGMRRIRGRLEVELNR